MTTGSRRGLGGWMLAALVLAVPTSVSGQATVVRDLDYLAGASHADGKDLLDVHMPAGARAAPVLVYFHGGGLTAGNKERGDIVADRLVPSGIGVVSANYRLSPGAMHPAHMQDATAAVAWVLENIESYGGDPTSVYVGGHSAGGYLAALMALDPSYLAAHGILPVQIAGAIPISAFLYVEETAVERSKSIWGENPAGWLAASVSPYMAPGKGRMLLIYADGDDPWRQEQNHTFGVTMRRIGNPARVVEVPNRDHGSLITDLLADDDEIGGLIVNFIHGED